MSSFSLDGRAVRRGFSSAAERYEAVAVLQQQVETLLLERLDGLYGPVEQRAGFTAQTTAAPLAVPRRIIDVGSGPGRASAALRKRFPSAHVVALDLALPMLQAAGKRSGWWKPFSRICGDAQAMPLASHSADLLFSNLCLQWCEPLDVTFAGFRRVLRPGSLLLFSSFGPDTLKELRGAWAEADQRPHVIRFLDMHDVGDALIRQGFRDPVIDVERFLLTYDDVATLMRELKAIGAGNHLSERARGLTGKGRLRAMSAAYGRLRDAEGRLPSSWEVIIGAARAPDEGQPTRTDAGGELAQFSVDRLRGSRVRRDG